MMIFKLSLGIIIFDYFNGQDSLLEEVFKAFRDEK